MTLWCTYLPKCVCKIKEFKDTHHNMYTSKDVLRCVLECVGQGCCDGRTSCDKLGTQTDALLLKRSELITFKQS